MKKQPLFSVLIANYNNGRFLSKAIESIFEQNYSNWEIIIVDDGSDDFESKLIYEKFINNNKIKIYYNFENKGTGFTKRKCVELAKGDLFGFVDPDDALTPNAVETLVDAFDGNLDLSMVYTNHFVCDKDLNVLCISDAVGPIPQYFTQLSYEGPKMGHFTGFKKSKYMLTTGINPILKRAVDQDIFYKMEEVGEIKFINIPTYYYRIHEGGISTMQNTQKAIYWNLKIMKDAMERRKYLSIGNISRQEYAKRFLQYYRNKLLEKKDKRQFIRFSIIFLYSLRYLRYDNRFSCIRIYLNYFNTFKRRI